MTEVLAAVVAAVEAEGERLLAEFHLPGGPRGAGSKAPIDEEIELRLRGSLVGLGRSLPSVRTTPSEQSAAPARGNSWIDEMTARSTGALKSPSED